MAAIYVPGSVGTDLRIRRHGRTTGTEFPFRSASTGDERDPDQAWFWTPQWQAREREADEEIAAGHTTYYESGEEFLAALDHETG